MSAAGTVFGDTIDALRGAPETPVSLETFADLFCGIGGFHVVASRFGLSCVFASDINETARDVYEANLGHRR